MKVVMIAEPCEEEKKMLEPFRFTKIGRLLEDHIDIFTECPKCGSHGHETHFSNIETRI